MVRPREGPRSQRSARAHPSGAVVSKPFMRETDKAKPQPIAQAVLAIVERLLGGTLCFVGRIVGPELLIHEVSDKHGLGLAQGQSIPLLDTMSGVVERTRATALCDDESPMACPFEKNLGLRSGLAVPLILRDGTIVGTLCALDRMRRSYTAKDVELVVDLARVVTAE